MDIVNPFAKETWRNHPAPHIDERLHKELARIGGKVPGGEYGGKPVLRFEWGQSEMAFRCGRMRLKYVDANIPAIERPRRYLWRHTSEFDRFDERGEPVYKREFKAIDEVPKVIPAGWFYQEDLPELEWIGKQLWFIAQWKPPDVLGDESTWERHRFDWWENPETGREEWTDMAGPFPRAGRYEPVMMIAQKRKALMYRANSFLDGQQELVEREIDFYAEPNGQHIEAVRRAWAKRERGSLETMMELSREAFRRDAERREKERSERSEDRRHARNEVSEYLKPKVFQQKVNLSNMPTRFGKGRKINVAK